MQSINFQTIYQFRSGVENSTEPFTENISPVSFVRGKGMEFPSLQEALHPASLSHSAGESSGVVSVTSEPAHCRHTLTFYYLIADSPNVEYKTPPWNNFYTEVTITPVFSSSPWLASTFCSYIWMFFQNMYLERSQYDRSWSFPSQIPHFISKNSIYHLRGTKTKKKELFHKLKVLNFLLLFSILYPTAWRISHRHPISSQTTYLQYLQSHSLMKLLIGR